jgi:hypothetical protein
MVRIGMADADGRLKQRDCRQAARKVGRSILMYVQGRRARGKARFYSCMVSAGLVMSGKNYSQTMLEAILRAGLGWTVANISTMQSLLSSVSSVQYLSATSCVLTYPEVPIQRKGKLFR